MSTLCAEPQFPAQATITQHWQKQEDALAASLVFEDSGFSCGVCVCVCVCVRERGGQRHRAHDAEESCWARVDLQPIYEIYIECVLYRMCSLCTRGLAAATETASWARATGQAGWDLRRLTPGSLGARGSGSFC